MSFFRCGRVFGYTYTIDGKTDKDVTLTMYDGDNKVSYEHITKSEAYKKIQKIYDLEIGINNV